MVMRRDMYLRSLLPMKAVFKAFSGSNPFNNSSQDSCFMDTQDSACVVELGEVVWAKLCGRSYAR